MWVDVQLLSRGSKGICTVGKHKRRCITCWSRGWGLLKIPGRCYTCTPGGTDQYGQVVTTPNTVQVFLEKNCTPEGRRYGMECFWYLANDDLVNLTQLF